MGGMIVLIGWHWQANGRASTAAFLIGRRRWSLQKCEPTGPRYKINPPRYLLVGGRPGSHRAGN